ncbi:hypothetical protein [Streptomyces sp. B21-101]|uniref:hypothetical protein n=1 Tax=Streptomyces sp. B21-101 TaxID=3039415 RepID=UPI002FF25D7C
MTEYWTTDELPGIRWDETQQPNPPTDPDLWGQGLTAFEQHTLTTVQLTGDLL